jgi:hypothetical protein
MRDAADPGRHLDETREEEKGEPEPPEWDDEYLDHVRDRVMHSYDLEKSYRVRGEPFTLYGDLRVESHKQFFHPSLQFGHYRSREYLFVRRAETVARRDLESLVELGHDLADEWIDPDEEHFSTEFTFVLVVPSIPEAVREYVSGFRDRTLLKHGYYGHYEVNLLVVAPDREGTVASREADVEDAFRVWEPLEAREPGLVERLVRRIWR